MKWTRWRTRQVSQTDRTEHQEEQQVSTTDNHPGTTEEKIHALRAEIDTIAAESAADPAALADNLQAWRNRESARQDRVVALEQQIRQLDEFGVLLDDQPAMDAIKRYTAAAAEARSRLAKVATQRTFTGARDTKAPKMLEQWLTELGQLAAALPTDDAYAAALLCREYTQWYRSRDGWLMAYVAGVDGAHWLPFPEADGGLPAGFTYGVHRAVEA